MSNAAEWKEKQELLMSLNDDSSEIEAAYDEKTSERPGAGTRLLKAATAIVIGCAVGFLLIQIGSRAFLRSHLNPSGDGVFKFSSQFRGADDVDVQQHVTSVVSDNYVMYHVVKPHESAWIIDDFEKSLQIMKIESDVDGPVCFVAHLNNSHSVTPDFYGLQLAEPVDGEPKRVQRTFYTDEMQLGELIHLGDRAMELCADTPTFWIFPVSDKMSQSVEQNEPKHRNKRNVRKCMTSCCKMVCCCNQRYLQWQQGGQKINCHNVCQGCSPLSKTNDIHMRVC